MNVVIIGGGIAGLAAAYYTLKQAPQVQVTLLDAGKRWGGKIATDRVSFDRGQFIVEGGPDTFLATKPWAVALCKELGLGERLHGTNPARKNTYVLHRGRLLPLPDGLAMMIPTNVQAILRSRLVSVPGKARMGLDFLLPPRILNGDESLGSFVSRRLGREAYENLIEPLMSGIYAGDGDLLSLASTFPYLRDLELKYGSLARGALQMRQQSVKYGKQVQGSRSAFLTPTTGLAELVEALVAWLTEHGADLRLDCPVQQITRAETAGYRMAAVGGEALPADTLVLAAPAYATSELLRELDPALADELRAIPYTSTATVSLAYRQADLTRPLDGYGYVIPRREERKALACTWTSTKFPHRAPEGYALVRVFIGRAGQDIPWNKADLIALAKEEVQQTLGVKARKGTGGASELLQEHKDYSEPVLERAFLWEKAMPQYNLGHPERLRRIDEMVMAHPGIALAGNGYRGIGIPDCIHSGELAASIVLEHLTTKPLRHEG